MTKQKQYYTIYKHTFADGTFYVGVTGLLPLERRWQHGAGYHNNKEFYRAIQLAGWDNISHEVIEIVEDKEAAHERETYWIQHFIALGYKSFNKYKTKGLPEEPESIEDLLLI